MKYLFTILLSLGTIPVAFGQARTVITQIEWSKVGRGFEESVRINADSVNVIAIDQKGTNGSKSFGRKTTPEEWKELVSLVQGINLPDMSKLPSPTLDRATDGALHSTIIITDAKKKEYSHGFDNDNPHESLKPLLESIQKISGIKDTR